jgi:lysophospholipase L1-like esterase
VNGLQVQPGLLGPQSGLITVTMGGNDMHFVDVLVMCATTKNCLDATMSVHGGADETDLVGPKPLRQWAPEMIDVVSKRLMTLYSKLRADAPNARIVVIGYPHLLPTGRVARQFDLCDSIVSAIDKGERQWLYDMQIQLTAMLRRVTSASRVEFIDPSADFADHEVCGIRGELLRSTNLKLNDPGVFHPTQQGQRLLARDLACYLNLNPSAPPTGNAPVLSSSAKDSANC